MDGGEEEKNDVDLRSCTVCSRLESCLEQDCDSGSRMTYMNKGLIGWEVFGEGLADAGTHSCVSKDEVFYANTTYVRRQNILLFLYIWFFVSLQCPYSALAYVSPH